MSGRDSKTDHRGNAQTYAACSDRDRSSKPFAVQIGVGCKLIVVRSRLVTVVQTTARGATRITPGVENSHSTPASLKLK
jgi:hypothetical protein